MNCTQHEARMKSNAWQWDVVGSKEELKGMKNKWNTLLSRCENRDMLLSHEWFTCWSKSFVDGEDIIVPVAQHRESLKFAMPLIKSKYIRNGIEFKVIHSMTNRWSPVYDLLCSEPSAETLEMALTKTFEATRHNVMVLEKVPQGSVIMKHIEDACKLSGMKYLLFDDMQSWRVILQGHFENYFNSLKSKFRKNVRAAERKALQRAPLVLLEPQSAEHMLELLERSFMIQVNSWKGRAGVAIIQNDNVKCFYTELAQECFSMDCLRLFLLTNGVNDIAFLLCVEDSDNIHALEIGINDDFSNIGPGMLIVKHSLERLFSRNNKSLFDFGRGHDRWKQDWANGKENHYKVFIFNNSAIGKSLFSLARLYTSFLRDAKLP